MFDIREDDLTGARTQALVALHLRGMHANTPAGQVFALDVSKLTSPEVTFFSCWQGEDLLAIGALKALGGGAAEVKSMRTHPDHLRKGAAAALLAHLVGVARARGYLRLSLETGSGPAFEPALAMYRRHGFTDGEAFAGYQRSAFNQFLHLAL